MTTLIKICGLRTPETLDAALDAGADFVGFVFFPASPRHVDLGAARDLGMRVQRQGEEGRAHRRCRRRDRSPPSSRR